MTDHPLRLAKPPLIASEWWDEYWPLLMGMLLVMGFIACITIIVVANRVEIQDLKSQLDVVSNKGYTRQEALVARAMFVGRLEADEQRVEYLERNPKK